MKRVHGTNGSNESALCAVSRLQAAKPMDLGAIRSGNEKLQCCPR